MRPPADPTRQRNNRCALAVLGLAVMLGLGSVEAPQVQVSAIELSPRDRQELAAGLGVAEARIAKAAEQGALPFLAVVLEGLANRFEP